MSATFPTDAIAIDIETTGLKWPDTLLVIGMAWSGDDGIESEAINVGMRDLFSTPSTIPEARRRLQERLGNKRWMVFHNGSFDIPYLLRSGLLTRDQLKGRIFDTLVMARCTAAHDALSLEALCEEYKIVVNGSGEWQRAKKLRGRLAEKDPRYVMNYAELDAVATLRLFQKVFGLAEDQYGCERIGEEGDFVLLMADIRMRGIPLDMKELPLLIGRYRLKEQAIIRYLLKRYGIKGPNDRTALPRLLSGWGLTVPRTAKGNPSLDEAALKEMCGFAGVRGRRLLNAVLKGRHHQKVLSTWLVGMLDQADGAGRVHPLFSVGGTMSHRLSCSNPNAQAVDSSLSIWHPDLVEADYGQAELRIAAMFAGEQEFARILADDDADLHGETARRMFGAAYNRGEHRRLGKSANFSTIYAGGARVLAEACGIEEDEARRMLREHRKAFPAFPRAVRLAEKTWIERGYLLLTHGKRIYANASDMQRTYKAFNNLVQGSVAEIIRKAMMEIDAHVPGVSIVNQVHDSLVLEVHPGADRERGLSAVREIMMEAVPEKLRARTTPMIKMKVDIK